MQSEPLTTILERFGGIATRGQLIGSGAHPDLLAAAVRQGQVLRVRRAHYATANADPHAVSAVRIGGRLTASSAARSYGLWGGVDPVLHVRLPSNGSRLRPSTTSGVDMRIDGKLLVVFDGYASHASKDAFERDRVRDSRARLRGAPVVRFTARQVLEHWPVVAETIDALLVREAA